MRITPQVIRIRDFRSFNEEQVISLAERPGTLGLITGVNQAEPDLGANGTGKSTIWDALCWCLFGKTIRGQRGPAILPWGVEVATPRVQFTFEVEGHRYTISRTANPNGIRLFREAAGAAADTSGLEAQDIDQESVERMIGLDYGLFLSTVVRGQFAEGFLELTPKKKMDFLSAALDLDLWDDASQKAAASKKEAKSRLQSVSRSRASCEGKLAALTDTLALASSAYERAVAADARDAKALSEKRAAAESDLEEARSLHSEVIGKMQEEQIEFAEFESREASHRVSLSALEEDYAALCQEHSGVSAKEGIARDAISAATGLSGQCPTCHSDITEECLREAQARAQQAWEMADADLHSVTSARDTVAAALDHRKQRQLGFESATRQVDKRLRDIQLEEVRLSGQVEQLSERLAALVPTDNPHTGKLKAHVDTVSSQKGHAEEDHEWACGEESAARQDLEVYDFWVKGFQDIRLWRLRAALDELEALANSHTLSLGLRGWRILFEVERETKSGGIAKGFRCLIQSPTSTDPVPLESWSGGEIQRLKIATQAAMCDLIRSRFGGAMALEVWDEPGQHLSERGCQDMMAFFRERAATLGIEVWIVDHRSTTSGEFDQQLVVTRSKTGTAVKRGLR